MKIFNCFSNIWSVRPKRIVFLETQPTQQAETAKKQLREATIDDVKKAIDPLLKDIDDAKPNELQLEGLVKNALLKARDIYTGKLDKQLKAQTIALNLIAEKAADLDGNGRIDTAPEVALQKELQSTVNIMAGKIEAQARQADAQIGSMAEILKPMSPEVQALALKLKQIKLTQLETLAQPDTQEVAVLTKAILDDLKPWHDGLAWQKKEAARLEKLEPEADAAEEKFSDVMAKYNIQNPEKFLAGGFFQLTDLANNNSSDPQAATHLQELQKLQFVYLNAKRALEMNPDWEEKLNQYRQRIPETEGELHFLTEQIPARIQEEIKRLQEEKIKHQQTENPPLVANLNLKSKPSN